MGSRVGSAPVGGVIGGCGGVGASRFAAVLAAVAATRHGQAVLVDLDCAGGGIDITLGVESTPGARWSGMRVAGGRLEPEVLLHGLPRWGLVPVLAADSADPPSAAAVDQVIESASGLGPVVVDLARWPSETRAAAVRRSRLVVAVVTDDIACVTAARSMIAGLGGPQVGIVVRSHASSGVDGIAELVGAKGFGRLPPLRGRVDAPLDPRRLPRRARQLADGVLDAVAR